MPDFEAPEQTWVQAHRDELIGMDAEAASEVVRAAGFRPIVYVPEPHTALAVAYWTGSVTLISIHGVVKRVSAG